MDGAALGTIHHNPAQIQAFGAALSLFLRIQQNGATLQNQQRYLSLRLDQILNERAVGVPLRTLQRSIKKELWRNNEKCAI